MDIMADRELKIKERALSGKLVSGDNPAMIGENFRQLTNLQYTDTHPIGIGGMTKINTTALTTYTEIKSGHHLRKDLPAESHVLVQAFNSGETAAAYYSNATAIPNAGDFTATALMTQTGTPSIANWSDAPGGNVIMCDGKGTYIYGGNEIKAGSFINYAPDKSFWYNFTQRIQNNISTGTANIATLSRVTEGTADSEVILQLHLDNNVTDSSPTTPHTVANYLRSDGSVGSDHCTSLTAWDDDDAVNGDSTQVSFGGYECFKLDSGNSAVGSQAALSKDFGVIGDNIFYASIRLYAQTLGTEADEDEFSFEVQTGNLSFRAFFNSDGLFVQKAAAAETEVGTDIIDLQTWTEWTFIVDATTPATATVEVYKDGVSQGTVDCDYEPGGTTDGDVLLVQKGVTSANQITYVDWIKVGTGSTSVTFDASTKVFGTHSAVFDGSTWLEIPDNADFNFADGTFTIDGRFQVDNLTTNHPIYYQQTDLGSGAEDYFYFYIDTNGAVVLSVYAAGAEVVAVSTPNSTIVASTWYHIALVENGDSWKIYVDGVLKGSTTDTSRAANYTSSVLIGRNDGATPVYYDGYMDEVRVSNTAKWTTDFEVPVTVYGDADYKTYGYVGSPRPLKGFKPYISTANTTAGSLVVEYTGASGWAAVGSLSDGTASGGIPFAQTGTVSFTSTDGLALPSIIDGIVLYWYRFYVTEMDATTAIYFLTLDCSMQTVKDTWDGIERLVLSLKFWDDSATSYIDYTTNIFEDSYVDTQSQTYAEIDSMTTSDYMEFGFSERQLGISFRFVPGHENSTANTVATVYYWTGATYTSVGTLTDGTSENNISFAKNGTISWSPVTDGLEFQKQISNEVPLYFYKIVFSQAIDSDAQLYHANGTTAPKTIPAYKFPLFAGDSVWLLNEINGKRNRVLRSVPNQADTWNGDLSLDFQVGNDSDLVAGSSIYMQIGNNIYEVLILCKRDQTWMVILNEETVQKFLVDARKGCTAPATMKTASLSAKDSLGTKRNVSMWQSDDAIVLYGGGSVIDISDDIKNYFDRTKSEAINQSYLHLSNAFFDENKHYHWCFYSGSTPTQKELVYDTDRDRWYEIDRGTGKRLYCGIEVEDTVGNKFSYGGISAYIERLENGTDFDGNDITHTLWMGDEPIAGTIGQMSNIKAVGVTCLATNTTANTITGSYYRDGKTTAEATFTLAPQKSGSVIATPTSQDVSTEGSAIYHSVKLVMVTDDETVGFEPMYLYYYYKITRPKLLGGS